MWKENNKNNYENIKILTHSNRIYSILYLEVNNILISGGLDELNFGIYKNDNNYENINCIKYFEDVKCGWMEDYVDLIKIELLLEDIIY